MHRVEAGAIEYEGRLSGAQEAPFSGLYRLFLVIDGAGLPGNPISVLDGSVLRGAVTREGRREEFRYPPSPKGWAVTGDDVHVDLWTGELRAGETVQFELTAARSNTEASPLRARVVWERYHHKLDPRDSAWLRAVILWSILLLVSSAVAGIAATRVLSHWRQFERF
jgi:hypothetical protein